MITYEWLITYFYNEITEVEIPLYSCSESLLIYRLLVAFMWLLRAIDHHDISIVYGIQFLAHDQQFDEEEKRYFEFVKHSTLADKNLNHSTKLFHQVLFL